MINNEVMKNDKIEFTGEIVMRERIDEDTKQKRYSVAIAMDNPFAHLFEGGLENEYNLKIGLGSRIHKAKLRLNSIIKQNRH